MLTLRYIVRLITTFISRFKAILLFGVLFGVGIFFLFSFAGSSIFGKTVDRVGLTGRYTIEELPSQVLSMFGSGLTRINDEGLVEPAIASSWETTDNGKTWIFHISGDAYWQDGKKVVSSEINYQFSDVEI